MNTDKLKTVTTQIVGSVAKKIAESAIHAAIFAYVSKKVTNLMTKQEEKAKIRVEDLNKNNTNS